MLSANTSWNIVNFRQGLIRALRQAGYEPVAVSPADADAVRRLGELGIAHVPISIDRSGLNPLADLGLLLRYRRILRRLRPAAFLGYTIKPNVYGSLAASSLGIPFFPNVSGLGTAFIRTGLLERVVSQLYRLAFRRASVVFFQNPDDRLLFTSRGIVRPERTQVLPGSGIDLNRFAAAPLPSGPPVFLLIARLLSDKGVREYAEAARLLRSKAPDVRVQLLGPIDTGNRTSITGPELQSWVEEGIIEYLGETDDVRPFVAAATAIVLPSYREGLPRSLLEGAAMARPLVATDVPGCRELVEPGVNGWLCTVRDPQSLAEAMEKITNLPHERLQAMGAASRHMVQDRFSEERVIRCYLDALGALQAA